MNPRILLVLTLAIAIVAGCKNPESAVVGKWSMQNQTLEFKADKTFKSSPEPSMVGKWSLDKNKVNLVVDTIGGKSKEQAMDDLSKMASQMGMDKKMVEKQKQEALKQLSNLSLTLSEDKKSLTMTNPTDGASVTLTKQAS